MTIASEIERLQNVRTDIYDELGNKCVNLDGSSKYADVAPIIKKMPVVCAKIGANKYPVVKIGNQLWTAKNLDEDLGILCRDKEYKLKKNSKFSKTNVNVGDVVDIEPQAYQYSASYGAIVIDCKEGDIITLHVRGGYSPRAYCFVDNDSVCVGVSSSNIEVDGDIIAPAGAVKCAINNEFAILTNPVVKLKTPNANSWYYNNDEATYKKYGRLYTWDNVNTNLASLGLQGWRMPTKADCDALVAIDSTGNKFRAKSFANGTDDYGFAALPSGYFNSSNKTFSDNGSRFMSFYDPNGRLSISYNGTMNTSSADFIFSFSVRLVLDLNEDGSIPDGAVIIAEADESAVATLADDEPSTDSEG